MIYFLCSLLILFILWRIIKNSKSLSDLEELIAAQQVKTRSKLDYLLKEIHKLGGGYQDPNKKCEKSFCDFEE